MSQTVAASTTEPLVLSHIWLHVTRMEESHAARW